MALSSDGWLRHDATWNGQALPRERREDDVGTMDQTPNHERPTTAAPRLDRMPAEIIAAIRSIEKEVFPDASGETPAEHEW